MTPSGARGTTSEDRTLKWQYHAFILFNVFRCYKHIRDKLKRRGRRRQYDYYSNVTPSPQRGKTIQEDYTHVTLGNRKTIPTLHCRHKVARQQEDYTHVTLGNRKTVSMLHWAKGRLNPTLHWATAGRPYPRYTGQQEDHTHVTLGNRKTIPTLHWATERLYPRSTVVTEAEQERYILKVTPSVPE